MLKLFFYNKLKNLGKVYITVDYGFRRSITQIVSLYVHENILQQVQ